MQLNVFHDIYIFIFGNFNTIHGKYKRNSDSVALKTKSFTVHIFHFTYELLRHVSKMS